MASLIDSPVCRCYVVRADVIRTAIRDHELLQVEEVTAVTRAGGGCSSCWDEIQAILSEVRGAPPPRNLPDETGLTAAQKRALIVELMERDTDPLLAMNGVSMQLVDVAVDRVLARFSGGPVGTPRASWLALKRELVRRMSDAIGRKMTLVELNVLEGLQSTRTA